MKTGNEKIKLSMMFDEYDSQLIRSAAKTAIAGHGHWCKEDEFTLRRDYRRIVMLAVLAYCRGVITSGKVDDVPMMAELRSETPEETRARVAGEMPNLKNLGNPAFKALHAKDENLAKMVQGMRAEEVLKMINDWEIYALVASGSTDKIPANALRFDAKFSAELCAMSKKARVEYGERVRHQIADLREYLKNLKNPDSIKAEPALSAAELRYCEAESIKPADFLKAKSQRSSKE